MCLKNFSLLILFCIVKCNSMSKGELEDFSDFLKRTSVLDQTLKKAPGVGASDEDEPISDINAWEDSGKFEGDLILNDRQRKVIVEDVAEGLSRNGLNDITKRWPDNMVIFYIQREHFNGGQVRAILQGIEDLARASCVKFRPYRKGDRDAVVVQGSRRGCFSQVGYQGGYQVLNLSGRHPVGRGCFRHGTIVHEFLHTLGFYHMQSSPDRDDYINVHWENIVEPAKHNFRKYNSFSVSDFGVGYDYDSVLHYSRKAFSSNGQDTLVPKQSGADIGQRHGLSDKDTEKLNKMYCDADNNNNNDENGPIIQRKPKKKRKSKNQPFDGHGIGYHQGKTLVIKVPTTATIQVTSSMPIYRTFDYSSKLPTTPVVQRVGTGQEVVYWSYPYNLYTNRRNNQQTRYRTDPQKFMDKTSHSPVFIDSSTTSTPKLNIVIETSDGNKNNNTIIEGLDKISVTKEAKNTTDSKHEELTAAIKRLEELVNTRLALTDHKHDYTKYLNPDIKFDTEPEIKKVDKIFKDHSFPKKQLTKSEKNKQIKTAHEFIQGLYDSDIQNDTLPETYKKTNAGHKNGDLEVFTPEMDSSFRTAYPFKKLDYHKANHELAEYKYDPIHKLSDKHNYSNLYFPIHDIKLGSAIKAHQEVFGESHNPLKEPTWYRKVELDNTPLRYDKNRYTYYGPDNRENKSAKLHSEQNSDENTRPTLGGYSLFGKPVPTKDNWFEEHAAYQPRTTEIEPLPNKNHDRSEPFSSANVEVGKNSGSGEVDDEKDESTSGYSLLRKPLTTNDKSLKPYHYNHQAGKNSSQDEIDDDSASKENERSKEELHKYLNYNSSKEKEGRSILLSENLQGDIYARFKEDAGDVQKPVTTAYDRLLKEYENYEPSIVENYYSLDENSSLQDSEETR